MNSPRPEFIRLPAPGEECQHTGFRRSSLYNLVVPCKANRFRPAVPAKCHRQPGNLRGIWLIPYEALCQYLHGLDTPGLAKQTPAKAAPTSARLTSPRSPERGAD